MSRTRTLLLLGLAMVVLGVPGWSQAPAQDKPATLVIKLPAGAELEIQGLKSKQTGEVRRFDTPPLAAGKQYSYSLKATWKQDGKDQTVTREIPIKAGDSIEIDLRQAKLPTPAAGSLTLEAVPAVTLKQGENKPLAIKIKRDDFKDPVQITFEAVPGKVSIGEATIPGDKDSVTVTVSAEKDAAAGASNVKVHAKSGKEHKEGTLKLTVDKAPPPPKPASLKLIAPATLVLDQGGKKNLALKVERDGVEGPVAVKIEGEPKGVAVKDATIAADKTGASIEVAAANDAEEGDTELKVTATGGTAKAEAKVKLTVKKAPSPKNASLKLTSPAAIVVDRGGKKALAIKIERDGVDGPVTVKIGGLPKGVTAKDVTIAADQTDASIEVIADKDAAEGAGEFKVTATGGNVKVETKIEITVKKAGTPPKTASLQLMMPATVTVDQGAQKLLAVKVARDGYEGPVTIKVEGTPKGVTIKDVTIIADKTEANIEVAADKDAKEGDAELKVTASGGALKIEAKVKLSVKKK